MKIYSDNAVTTSVINELDAKQSREIEKLKKFCWLLLAGEVVTLAVAISLHFMN